MAGAKAATSSVNAALGSWRVEPLRRGLIEKLVHGYRVHAEQSRASDLARMTWTEDRREHAGPAGAARDLGSTPLRWTRLT